MLYVIFLLLQSSHEYLKWAQFPVASTCPFRRPNFPLLTPTPLIEAKLTVILQSFHSTQPMRRCQEQLSDEFQTS